jgi:hypothetical protein
MFEFLAGEWLREVEALTEVAAHALDALKLCLVLDALNDCFELEDLCELRHRRGEQRHLPAGSARNDLSIFRMSTRSLRRYISDDQP